MNKIVAGINMIKSFGLGDETYKALNKVSVEVHEGEFVAVMGTSGSGKSTLLFALSGMDTIDEGSVVFDGQDLAQLKENQLADIRRTKMGFVFQQPTLLNNLNMLDNIVLPSLREHKRNRKSILYEAKVLMKKTGIGELEQRDITQVSGGQLQRAGICRALMNHPQIIFADEPTGALNSKSAEEIMNLFSDINQEGTAIMLVTHDAKVAARAERILFMKDGIIVSEMRLSKNNDNNIEKRIVKITNKMQEIGI